MQNVREKLGLPEDRFLQIQLRAAATLGDHERMTNITIRIKVCVIFFVCGSLLCDLCKQEDKWKAIKYLDATLNFKCEITLESGN